MVVLYRRPSWLNALTGQSGPLDQASASALDTLREQLMRGQHASPELSVLLPVEELSTWLLPCLISLSTQRDAPPSEYILAAGPGAYEHLVSLRLPVRILKADVASQASQLALEQAKGRYVLCAQPNTLYPPDWAVSMTQLLQQGPERSCVYGSYRFLPSARYAHWKLALYRYLADPIQSFRAARHEYANVMGFNMGFRRLDALRAGGFPEERALDRRRARETAQGRLALRLSRFGKLHYSDEDETRVWTSTEGLEREGGLAQAFRRRVGRELARSLERRRRIVIE
jgi:hypothetical protein